MENAQIADMFDQIADLLDLTGANAFRIRSYHNAARTVRGLSQRLEDLVAAGEDLTDLPGIGQSTAAKIREILDTGTCKRLEELRSQVPEGLPDLMRVPGLGPRKAMQLHDALGVATLDDLRTAAEEHRISTVEHFGARSEEKILEGIRTATSTAGRMLYHDAAGHVEALSRRLDGAGAVERWVVAGSFRRGMETVGDLDILVLARDRDAAIEQILAFDNIAAVDSRGREKATVRLEGGLQVDFRFFEEESFGAAMMYFTGSKAHNIALRRMAQQRGWKLNEYGLFDGRRMLAGRSEEALYGRLNLPWIPPEIREDRGEIDAAAAGRLPSLIELKDVRGDFQSHTTASDGTAGIEEMAQAAQARGHSYLAITDHSRRVTMAHGLDEDRCRRHADRIRRVNDTLEGLWLMAGIEVDILKDGSLDLDEGVLADLDWVVASAHYDRNLPEKAMTDRLVRAISSGVVHCLGHPLGRIIGRREPLAFDFDAVMEACRDHDVWLEVNGQPDRLDLPEAFCRRARDGGVQFTFGSDAHRPEDLSFIALAVNVARRGWLQKKDVINTLTAGQLRKRLNRSRIAGAP
ncbi:MAG: DNA polymerase/3'-5' exonuclease PolX [Planctomycetes bacterium]|nr:DNA polymerase/3'-5' exonuclease PolX [Planctomycetota bacterium]